MSKNSQDRLNSPSIKNKLSELDDSTFLGVLRDRFQIAANAERENREEAKSCAKFTVARNDAQWDAAIATNRKNARKPVTTVNQINRTVKSIQDPVRQNPPCIEVLPVGEDANEEVAAVNQGLIKHVENNGEGAQVVYPRSYQDCIIGGMMAWQIFADYIPGTMDQELYIGYLHPSKVYFDPASERLDKSDANWCEVTHIISLLDFARDYPNARYTTSRAFAVGVGDGEKSMSDWVTADSIRIVEFYWKEFTEKTLYKMIDGSCKYDDELTDDMMQFVAKDSKGEPICRKEQVVCVYKCIATGAERLTEIEEFPIDEIPIVYSVGDIIDDDGKIIIKGAVEDLKPLQRTLNAQESAILQALADTSKAQWKGDPRAIEGYEQIWKNNASESVAYLPHHSSVVNENGQIEELPEPKPVEKEAQIQALSLARQQTQENLRTLGNTTDYSQAVVMGAESGRALEERRKGLVVGANVFTAALGRAIMRTGQILLKWMPKVYDTARVVRITGKDNMARQVWIYAGSDNHPSQDIRYAGKWNQEEHGKDTYDISVGTYEVVFRMGTGDETIKQQAVETMTDMVKSAPQLGPVISDVIVSSMPYFDGKQQIIERLQKLLPAQLQAGGQQNAAQMAAQVPVLMQENQKLQAQLQQALQVIQTKQLETEGKLAVEKLQQQGETIRAVIKENIERTKIAGELAKEHAKASFTMVHDHALQDSSQQHDTNLAHLGQVHNMMTAMNPPQPSSPDTQGQ